MSLKRRLQAEILEKRQLLAANCIAASGTDLVASDVARAPDRTTNPVLVDAPSGEGEFSSIRSSAPDFATDFVLQNPIGPYVPFLSGPDLVQEHGDRVFVVDSNAFYPPRNQLVIFDKTSEGVLQPFASVDLDISVDRLFVSGENVVLIGQDYDYYARPLASETRELGPKTIALTIALGSLVDDETDASASDASDVISPKVTRQEFDGYLVDVRQDNHRLLLTTHESIGIIAIYPPPPIEATVRSLEILSEGLVEIASIKNAQGQSVGASGTILTGRTVFPNFFNVEESTGNNILPPDVTNRTILTQHSVGESSIELVASLDLGEGRLVDLHIADDASTAIAVRSLYTGNRQAMFVDLLDLSQAEVRVFETVTIEDADGYALSIDTDHVLISNYLNNDSLILIETNQSIDLAAENRVRKIELVEHVQIQTGGVRVSGEKILFVGHRYLPVIQEFVAEPSVDFTRPPGFESFFVTVSLETAELTRQAVPGEGTLAAIGNQIQVIDPETDRIGFLSSVVSPAGIIEVRFDYGQLDATGTFVSEGLIANAGHWLEVDVNSQRLMAREANRLLQYNWDDIENPIVRDLIDEDRDPIKAVDDFFTLRRNEQDHYLDVLANDQFELGDVQYLDGVHGSLFGDRHEPFFPFAPPVRITQLVDAPAGVRIDGQQIRVMADAIANTDSFRFQYVISDGVNESTATVEVEVRDVEQSKLAELGLRIVNDAGEAIETLTSGDTFWIEFVAQDLRRDGNGVYAAFLNLDLPEELIRIDGPIEYGDGFRSIAIGSFTETQLINLGAIGGIVEAPGNDGPQSIFRIKATALAAGETILIPTAADALGAETLLHGLNAIVPNSRVRYERTALVIAEAPDPEPDLDSNGDGEVTAADALKVINFLNLHGVMSVDSIGSTAEAEERSEDALIAIRRNDTNHDGQITPLDALVVINALQRQSTRISPNESASDRAEGESIALASFNTILTASLVDDHVDDHDDAKRESIHTVF